MTKQEKENLALALLGFGAITLSIYLGSKIFGSKDSKLESKGLKRQRVRVKNTRIKDSNQNIESNFYHTKDSINQNIESRFYTPQDSINQNIESNFKNLQDSNEESKFHNQTPTSHNIFQDSIKDSNKHNLESFGDYAYTDSIRFAESNYPQDSINEYENLESYSQYPAYKVSLKDISDQVASNDDSVGYDIMRNRQDSPIALLFDGVSLNILVDGNIVNSFQAVSGYPTKSNGKYYFSYEKDKQMLENKGSIPEGNYFINTSDIVNIASYKLHLKPS